ncbi:hypothetical protein BC938DRAFT_470640 [Jimgerdemannia flammicorona]|uniref:Uncharacterized protein n=1 Tax=Jimgerdemannia flammicorona TaxID=994334 RepID=A0A433Q9Q1_9FUNG|nr:hypothetical protein BC938DRAFT_470640 [Jimgerdemannia flammicorona]
MSAGAASGPTVNLHNSTITGIGVGTINGAGLPKRIVSKERIPEPQYDGDDDDEDHSDVEERSPKWRMVTPHGGRVDARSDNKAQTDKDRQS